MPPRTNKRRTTTNLKTKNNQNCQKIELYGSLTTKELKKKHPSRVVGRVERGSQGGEDAHSKAVDWAGEVLAGTLDSPHIHMWISQEEQLGTETDHATQGSSVRN